MRAFPDCSFLCAIHRLQDNSSRATAWLRRSGEALSLSALLVFEFRQSIRLQNFLFAGDRTRGFPPTEGARMLVSLHSDLATGAARLVTTDWLQILSVAERVSAQHTVAGGHRTVDVLHVATALHLGAREFLTFDARQASLATAEGLEVRP